jgi:hypothetical protein
MIVAPTHDRHQFSLSSSSSSSSVVVVVVGFPCGRYCGHPGGTAFLLVVGVLLAAPLRCLEADCCLLEEEQEAMHKEVIVLLLLLVVTCCMWWKSSGVVNHTRASCVGSIVVRLCITFPPKTRDTQETRLLRFMYPLEHAMDALENMESGIFNISTKYTYCHGRARKMESGIFNQE